MASGEIPLNWSPTGVGTVAGNTSKTFTVSNNFRGLIFSYGSHDAVNGMFMFTVNGSGTGLMVEIYKGSQISISGNTNTVTVQNSNTNNVNSRIYAMIFAGSITQYIS